MNAGIASSFAVNDVVAVVLAAGRGTRMGKLTETVPKPLVPVLGKPALHWVLGGLSSVGVRRVVIVTGYLSELVKEATVGFGGNSLDIVFVEQKYQLGTADALKLTHAVVGGAPVLLAFADIMTSPENYRALLQRFFEDSCDLTAGVRNMGDPYRSAAVYVDDANNILNIIEKPEKGKSATRWSHAGMYCFSNMIFSYLEKVQPSARGEYEVTDAVKMMIESRQKCRMVEFHGYWKDLATPEDVAEAANLMSKSAHTADA